jgi:hypothetical protein
MKILVLCGLLFSLLGTTLSAQAIPTLELKEWPPLKPLHYCQDSEGRVKAQNGECEPGKTEVSSITTIRNGKVIHAPLGKTFDTLSPDAKPGGSASPNTPATTPDALVQPPNSTSRQEEIKMKAMAFFIAIFGVVITFVGFGFAGGIKSKVISILAKFAALAIGALSLIAIQSLFGIKGMGSSGGYWVAILFGIWLLSRFFKGGWLEKLLVLTLGVYLLRAMILGHY